MELTVPGLYDVDDATYFAHDALSHSDLKLLARSPAVYRWHKDNPGNDDKTDDMVFGSAVHSLVLGGPDVVCVPHDSWRTKEAKEMRDDAEARGAFALKQADYDRAKACADAVHEHAVAAKLLANLDHAEAMLLWDDDDVQCRAKVDGVAGKFVIDLKTSGSADHAEFGRSAAQFGYWTQAAWYLNAARAVLELDDPEFLFVVVEKYPPHLTNVIKLDSYDVELGARRNARLVELFRRCRDADHWPGYEGVNVTELPAWARIQEETA